MKKLLIIFLLALSSCATQGDFCLDTCLIDNCEITAVHSHVW